MKFHDTYHIDGLMQKECNSSVLVIKLRLLYSKSSIQGVLYLFGVLRMKPLWSLDNINCLCYQI